MEGPPPSIFRALVSDAPATPVLFPKSWLEFQVPGLAASDPDTFHWLLLEGRLLAAAGAAVIKGDRK